MFRCSSSIFLNLWSSQFDNIWLEELGTMSLDDSVSQLINFYFFHHPMHAHVRIRTDMSVVYLSTMKLLWIALSLVQIASSYKSNMCMSIMNVSSSNGIQQFQRMTDSTCTNSRPSASTNEAVFQLISISICQVSNPLPLVHC